MMKLVRYYLICLFFLTVLPKVNGQNLEKIGTKEMARVSGGVQSNVIGNATVNEPQFRDPFSWVLSGNVTVSFLELSLPFTFSFSNTGKSFTQPFNMTAVHPKYKNWQAHLGITSMSLSKYTYQGLNFTGAGLEYKPNKWSFKAFGGRLKKAIEFDPIAMNINEASYKRMGFGFATGYQGKLFSTELILLKAQDDPSSLQLYHNNPELTAKNNLVASLKGDFSLLKSLQIRYEIATSLLTRDVLTSDPTSNSKFYHNFVDGNSSSVITNAYNASINYRLKTFGIGLQYERIDPEYATLGALYFNNDLENITVNPSISLFKNKVSFALSGGFQRNNLNARNASDDKRWVGNVSMNAQIMKGMTFSLNYSNLSSFSRKNPSADPFFTQLGDTLNFYQISQNASSSLNYSFGKQTKQSISLSGTYARSQNITGRLEDAAAFGFNVTATDGTLSPVDVYNAVFSHMLQPSRLKMSVGWTMNMNHSIVQDINSTYLGPGINASRGFLNKKLTTSLGATYNQQYLSSALSSHVLSFRTGVRFSPELWDKKFGKLAMALNGTWTNKLAVQNLPNRQNITIIVNLSYQL